MSTSREVTVWCDFEADGRRCMSWTYGHNSAPQRTGREARRNAAKEGWRHRDGHDLCPCHAGTCRSELCEVTGIHPPGVALTTA